MAVKWNGLVSMISGVEDLPRDVSLVGLGHLDKKGNFEIIGAVFAPSQDTLVRDILKDGGIRFANGASYDV